MAFHFGEKALLWVWFRFHPKSINCFKKTDWGLTMEHTNKHASITLPLILATVSLLFILLPALLPLLLPLELYARLLALVEWRYLYSYAPLIGILFTVSAVLIYRSRVDLTDRRGRQPLRWLRIFGLSYASLITIWGLFSIYFYYTAVQSMERPINRPFGKAHTLPLPRMETSDAPINSIPMPDSSCLIYGTRRSYPIDLRSASGFVMRIATDGLVLWNRTYPSYTVRPTVDKDGTIAVALTPFRGNMELRIARLTATGDSIDTRFYHKIFNLSPHSNIIPCKEGGYLVMGGIKPGACDVPIPYLLRLKSNGDTLWSRTYPDQENFLPGSIPNSMIQLSDGGFVMVGSVNQPSTNTLTMRMIRVDGKGSFLWDNRSEPVYHTRGLAVSEIRNGYLAILAHRNPPKTVDSNGEEGLYMKVDRAGKIVWTSPLKCCFAGKFLDMIPYKEENYLVVTGITMSLPPTILQPTPKDMWQTYAIMQIGNDGKMINGFYGEQDPIKVFGVANCPQGGILITGTDGNSVRGVPSAMTNIHAVRVDF